MEFKWDLSNLDRIFEGFSLDLDFSNLDRCFSPSVADSSSTVTSTAKVTHEEVADELQQS